MKYKKKKKLNISEKENSCIAIEHVKNNITMLYC